MPQATGLRPALPACAYRGASSSSSPPSPVSSHPHVGDPLPNEALFLAGWNRTWWSPPLPLRFAWGLGGRGTVLQLSSHSTACGVQHESVLLCLEEAWCHAHTLCGQDRVQGEEDKRCGDPCCHLFGKESRAAQIRLKPSRVATIQSHMPAVQLHMFNMLKFLWTSTFFCEP